GIVPHRFAKTKAITHHLIEGTATRPEGWSQVFSECVSNLVLPGYTAFSIRDAKRAAERMIQTGIAIRIKRPLSSGGRGQTVIAAIRELEKLVGDLPSDEIATYGIILEENLRQSETLSV